MSQCDILPWGTEQGGEGGEWSEVDNNQKSTINTRMEEPVLWATAVNVNRSLSQTGLYFILLSLYCAYGLVVKNSFSIYYSI